MIINHNITALNTHRQLGSATNAQASSMEKLSSGLRINSAKDDAAGLSISEKMRGQIRGLEQASKNAQDGISLMQTAEGALNETHDILQRMRELSVQGANDTNTLTDRKEIQKEMNQLIEEIDRISTDTEFNTTKLLNGELASTGTPATGGAVIHIGANKGQALTIDIKQMDSTTLGGGTSTGPLPAAATSSQTAGTSGNIVLTDSTAFTGTTGTWTLATADGTAFTLDKGDGTGPQAFAFTGDTVTEEGLELDRTGITLAAGDTWTINVTAATPGGTTPTISSLKVADVETATAASGGILSQAGADAAIENIQKAIEQVSAERSKIGAFQNRLDHTINNLATSSENMTAAESRIRDVDYAKAA